MEFYRCFFSVTFVVLTVDQFVGRDDGLLGELAKRKLLVVTVFISYPLSSF